MMVTPCLIVKPRTFPGAVIESVKFLYEKHTGCEGAIKRFNAVQLGKLRPPMLSLASAGCVLLLAIHSVKIQVRIGTNGLVAVAWHNCLGRAEIRHPSRLPSAEIDHAALPLESIFICFLVPTTSSVTLS